MSVDNTSLTQEEIDFLAQATLSRRIANRGDVTALDRVESGTLKYALSRAKNFGPPVQGGFRFYVKGNRNQRIQWWQGADLLTFDNQQTLSDMVFDVGKGHMGYELIYDTIERNGIRVDYNKGIREGGSDKSVLERVVNIIEQTMDDVEYAWLNDLRKRFMTSNADEPRCFTGRDGLIDPTTNTSGSIGKRPRSNRLFQHQLITGIGTDNIMAAFFKMVRAANRRAGNTKIDWISCGDEVYNTLVALFTAAAGAGGGMAGTVAGKFDYQRAQDKAAKKGEKYNISLPQDCFMYEDTLIVNDPVYELLDQDYPAATPKFSKRIDFWNFSHFGIIPVTSEMNVPHAMPYNQRLMRTSVHGEWSVWCDLPSSQGVMTLS
jgi:hypothetical protein